MRTFGRKAQLAISVLEQRTGPHARPQRTSAICTWGAEVEAGADRGTAERWPLAFACRVWCLRVYELSIRVRVRLGGVALGEDEEHCIDCSDEERLRLSEMRRFERTATLRPEPNADSPLPLALWRRRRLAGRGAAARASTTRARAAISRTK